MIYRTTLPSPLLPLPLIFLLIFFLFFFAASPAHATFTQLFSRDLGGAAGSASAADVCFTGLSADMSVAVIANSITNELQGVNLNDGSVAFTKSLAGLMCSVISSATADLAAVVRANGTAIHWFNTKTGAELLETTVANNGTVAGLPAISGTIIAYKTSSTVYAVKVTVSPVFSAPSAWTVSATNGDGNTNPATTAPIICGNGTDDTADAVVYVDSGNSMISNRISNGVQSWKQNIGASMVSPNGICQAGKIIVMDSNKKVHVRKVSDGSLDFAVAATADSAATCASPLFFHGADAAVVFTCDNGKLGGIDKITGGVAADLVWWGANITTDNDIADSVKTGATLLMRAAGSDSVKDTYMFSTPSGKVYSFARQTDSVAQMVSAVAAPASSSVKFNRVPVVGLTAAGATRENQVALFGNQQLAVGVKWMNPTITAAPLAPGAEVNYDYGPVLVTLDIGVVCCGPKASQAFDAASWISATFFPALSLSSKTNYRLVWQSPIGGSLWQMRILFASQDVYDAAVKMTRTQMDGIKIKKIGQYAAPVTAAPIERRDVVSPLSAAIGATSGIIVLFLIFFGVGIYLYTKEMPKTVDALASRSTAFPLSNEAAAELMNMRMADPSSTTVAVSSPAVSLANFNTNSSFPMVSDPAPLSAAASPGASSPPYVHFDDDL